MTVVASHAFISRSTESTAASLPTDHNIGGDTTENIGAHRSIHDNKGQGGWMRQLQYIETMQTVPHKVQNAEVH